MPISFQHFQKNLVTREQKASKYTILQSEEELLLIRLWISHNIHKTWKKFNSLFYQLFKILTLTFNPPLSCILNYEQQYLHYSLSQATPEEAKKILMCLLFNNGFAEKRIRFENLRDTFSSFAHTHHHRVDRKI